MNVLECIPYIGDFVVENALFRINDFKTRELIYNGINLILDQNPKDDDFLVVCDERNNPPHIIDNNILRYDIIIYLNDCQIHIFRQQLVTRNSAYWVEDYTLE